MTNQRGFWRHQFPAIAWAVVIFGISSLPGSVIPISLPFQLDKLFHAGIFFILCLLLNRALFNQNHFLSLSDYHLVISLLVVIAYGVSDELHQTVVPGRDPDFYDALADSLGGLACTFYLLLQKNRVEKRRDSSQETGSQSP
jgi:VanZ family protein